MMTNFLILYGGIAAFGLFMLLMDRLARRQDRQRALKDHEQAAGSGLRTKG